MRKPPTNKGVGRTKEDWLKAREHSGRSLSGVPYTYLNLPESVVSTARIRFKCPDHSEYEVTAHSHLKHGCRDCSKTRVGLEKRGKPGWRKFTLADALEKARALHPDLNYSKVKRYDPKGTWTVGCPDHGFYTVGTKTHLWDKTRGCPDCRAARKKVTAQSLSVNKSWQFEEQVKRFDYTVVSYTRAHEPAVLVCKTHGEFTVAKAYYLSQHFSICPSCRYSSSTDEVVVRDLLTKAGLKVELHRRDLIKVDGKALEIDLYLPEYKVGIEINGVYWHRDKPRFYHVGKTLAGKEAGITVLHFTDTEVRKNADLVASVILSKCGMFKHRLGARDTKVLKIQPKVCAEFLEANHLQGFHGATHHYALTYVSAKGKTVIGAVASFSKPRFDKFHDWELIRFASKRRFQIYGALSKLLSAFHKEHPGSVISYASLRYSTGVGYEACGFKLLRKTAPSYAWHSMSTELSRYQTQKKNLDMLLDDYDPELTETENMEMNGFTRLWDCGNLVYSKDFK